MKTLSPGQITGCVLTAVAVLQLAPVVRADSSGVQLARAKAEKIKAKANANPTAQ